MDNYNWPTLSKILPDAIQNGAIWTTADGREYLDCFTDVGASPISNETMERWLIDGIQAGCQPRVPHAYSERLRDYTYPSIIGEELGWDEPASIFYSNSGTEAVEAAIKLARIATGKPYVLGIVGDFHGRTYGALALHYDPRDFKHPSYHFNGFGPMLSGVFAVNEEWWQDVPTDDVAALVISPIQGNNTLEDTPDWVWRMAAYIRERGGLIVFDEVQTGFGRGGGMVSVTTASWWRHYAGLKTWPDLEIAGAVHDVMLNPDIHVFGKACGAGWPMSLTVCRSDLSAEMPVGSHFNTMSGSPLGCYLSARLLDELETGLLDAMLFRSARLADAIPSIIRRGYMMAIATEEPYALVERAKEAGLILMTARPDKPVRLSPPFVMTPREEQILFDTLRDIV